MTEDKHKKAAALLADGLRQVEVAEEVGVSPRTVRRWKKQGKLNGIESPDTGPDTPASAGTGGRPKANGATGKPTSLSSSRARKEAALALKHELDAAERTGELVTRSHLRDFMVRTTSAIESSARSLSKDAAEILDIPQREALPFMHKIADRILGYLRDDLIRWAVEEGGLEGWAEEEAPDGS